MPADIHTIKVPGPGGSNDAEAHREISKSAVILIIKVKTRNSNYTQV